MVRCRRKLTMYDLAVFRVCIRGMLDASWSDYFGTQSVTVEVDEEGIAVTSFITETVDQAALIGLINRLNALGLPLLAVEALPDEDARQAGGAQLGEPPAN
jgi:hypothetical protein